MIPIFVLSLLLFDRIDIETRNSGFAIVELFTSEGCSSCPPADRLLSQIRKDYKDQNVYTLSFHVDYWNYIGWKDPFSTKQYTSRQREYGYAFKNESIYTPQMVINGSSEFVGHQEKKAKKEINEALKRSTQQTIKVNLRKTASDLTIDYQLIGKIESDDLLHIAITESQISTDVRHGENRGRLLKHDSVVRLFKSVDLNSEGLIKIQLPEKINLTNSELLFFSQNIEKMIIKAVYRYKF